MLSAAVDARGDLAKPRLLLVDDEPTNLLALHAALAAADHELVLARSGAEALRALETQDFAVILVAVQMAVLDGFATAAKIKTMDGPHHAPIILLSATDRDEARAYESGAVDLIQRPFDPRILLAKVSVFVELHRAREQVRRQEIARRDADRANLLDRELRARGEAERLAASLVEADRLQQQFLSTLGQELRPPLNAILGWIRMLRDGSIREAQRGRALETVERNATAQLELIEEMIDISRMTSGTLALELARVDLVKLVGLVVEAVRPAAVAKQVTLFAALDHDVAPMSGDAERLRQVVHRLVHNAVSCTPTEGLVTVSLGNAGAAVELAITDTGAGIEPELAPRLFDRFAGETPSTSRAAGGLGVGLAIARHLVELHEGTIRVESTGPTGCRFVVSLPIAGRPPRTDDEIR